MSRSLNKVMLIGNVGNDPEVRQGCSHSPYAAAKSNTQSVSVRSENRGRQRRGSFVGAAHRWPALLDKPAAAPAVSAGDPSAPPSVSAGARGVDSGTSLMRAV